MNRIRNAWHNLVIHPVAACCGCQRWGDYLHGEPIVNEPKLLSVWRHHKGGLYIVVGVATCSTNGERDGRERSVIYHSTVHGHLRYRELTEFMDGRFTEVK